MDHGHHGDLGHPAGVEENGFEEAQPDRPRPRPLPDDLPTSLDDRRRVPSYGGETEMYDAWQGKLSCWTSLSVNLRPCTLN